MKIRRRSHVDAQGIERELSSVWQEIEPLPDDVVRSMAAEAAKSEREPAAPRDVSRRRFAALGSLRLAAVGVAVGACLGFGFAELTTDEGTASNRTIGFGFLPSDGWNVVQAGTVGSAHAVAANVALSARDGSKPVPYETLRQLPPSGAVIVARLVPLRDDQRRVVGPRQLPLELGEATPAPLPASLSDSGLVAFRLRSAVSGHDLDARIFLGAPPSPETLSAVDGQLRRLVVAPSDVSLVVQPALFKNTGERMTIYGAVSSGRAGEKVTVQFKACGLQPVQFRDAFETTTQAGGSFSLAGFYRPFNLGVSGVFRAVSGGDVSEEVRVQQRAAVFMHPLRGANRGRYRVRVWGKVSFWRRFVLIQRFERRRGVWITTRRLALTEENGSATPSFRPSVPKGTQIRAVFPLSQARPCYLAGYGPILRT
jgi:hypothetical protein